MRNLQKILSVVFLLFFIFIAPSCAEIKSVKIREDDRGLIDFDNFEFTNTGHVSVAISSVSVTAMPVTYNLSRPDLSRIGFFIVSDDAINYMNSELNSCYLDSKFILLLFTFQDLSLPSQTSFNKSYTVTYQNYYTLKFANCNPLSHVTMDVQTEFYNTHNGTTKDYLSAGQTNLPSLYFNLSIVYLCSLAFWISICFKNHPSFHWIHLLMGVLLLMKGINLLSAAKVQYSIKVTGTPHGWDVLLYIFQFIRIVLFYTVILVIIDVCSFLKSVFPVQNGLIIVIPFQIFAAIASKVGREVLLQESWNWQFGLIYANGFCEIVFIMLIGFAVSYESPVTDKAVENYSAKFSLIRLFYIVFILYSCIDYVCGAAGSDWAMAVETASLVLYMVMFFLFRPSEENEYSVPVNLKVPWELVRDVELGCGV